MAIRVLVNGAGGRMGSTTVKAIQQAQDLLLVQETHHTDDLKKAIQSSKADVVVDFTNSEVVFANTKKIIAAGARPVIGTSGLTPVQIKNLQQLCSKKQLGGLIVPNFCISALLMMRFAAQAAHYFSEIEIIETHHDKKLDAPSGTALKTAEMIAEARAKKPTKKKIQETLPGSRGALKQQIPIHALRLPGFLAKQEVILGHLGGRLTICHETIDREAFMPGVLLACREVMQQNQLLYGLEHLLK